MVLVQQSRCSRVCFLKCSWIFTSVFQVSRKTAMCPAGAAVTWMSHDLTGETELASASDSCLRLGQLNSWLNGSFLTVVCAGKKESYGPTGGSSDSGGVKELNRWDLVVLTLKSNYSVLVLMEWKWTQKLASVMRCEFLVSLIIKMYSHWKRNLVSQDTAASGLTFPEQGWVSSRLALAAADSGETWRDWPWYWIHPVSVELLRYMEIYLKCNMPKVLGTGRGSPGKCRPFHGTSNIWILRLPFLRRLN